MANDPRLVTIGSGAAILLHPCRVCGAEASFGSGVSLRQDRLGTWHCAQHRPATATPERPPYSLPAPKVAGQGKLF